jgi:hypothetical protein
MNMLIFIRPELIAVTKITTEVQEKDNDKTNTPDSKTILPSEKIELCFSRLTYTSNSTTSAISTSSVDMFLNDFKSYAFMSVCDASYESHKKIMKKDQYLITNLSNIATGKNFDNRCNKFFV